MVEISRCGCGGECACSLVAGTNVQVTGSGTSAVPWVVSALTNCAQVRTCISANDGAEYNPVTGVIGVCVSPNAGNGLTQDANGCLYVAGAPGTVVAGCGLTGDGSVATPIKANTGVWPFTCPPETNGSVVACDATGLLKGEPPYHTYYFESLQEQLFPANPTVPAGDDVVVQTFSFPITNPDPCRIMRVIVWRDLDVSFDLPPGADATSGISTDDMTHVDNAGTGTETTHTQVGKITQPNAALGPGAGTVLTRSVMGPVALHTAAFR